jgi:hypothetical protein
LNQSSVRVPASRHGFALSPAPAGYSAVGVIVAMNSFGSVIANTQDAAEVSGLVEADVAQALPSEGLAPGRCSRFR